MAPNRKAMTAKLWKQRYGFDIAVLPTDEFDRPDESQRSVFDELSKTECLFQIGIIHARLEGDTVAEAAEEAEYAQWQARNRHILQSRAYRRWKRSQDAYWETPAGQRDSEQMMEAIDRTARTRERLEAESQEVN